MIKGFYKKTKVNNYFFSKSMKVRSAAVGKEVQKKFLDWKKDFLHKKSALRNRFVLSLQDDILGRQTEELSANSFLPPLCASGVLLTITNGGHVSVNGDMLKESVGTELKGWALMPLTENAQTEWYLCVVGKPENENVIKLTIFLMSDDKRSLVKKHSVELKASLDISSYVTCFDRHVLIVHNGVLDYYYYDTRFEQLQRVAVGCDGNNEDFEWCSSVRKKIVCCESRLFWQSGNDIYSFSIGYPLKLSKITCGQREIVEDIFGSQDGLLVMKKDKNIKNVTCIKYTETQMGDFVEAPVQEFMIKQLLKI